MSHTTPQRDALAAFIKNDLRTLRAFEELFDRVNGLLGQPGDIVTSAADSRPGALFADGSSLLRTDYPDLFTAIGAKYGSVDGLHFNIPDLRGRVMACREVGTSRLTVAGCGINGTVLGAAGGTQTYALQVSEMPAHHHGFTAVQNTTGTILGAGATFSVASTAANTTDAGSGNAHQNVQPTIILNAFIVY